MDSCACLRAAAGRGPSRLTQSAPTLTWRRACCHSQVPTANKGGSFWQQHFADADRKCICGHSFALIGVGEFQFRKHVLSSSGHTNSFPYLKRKQASVTGFFRQVFFCCWLFSGIGLLLLLVFFFCWLFSGIGCADACEGGNNAGAHRVGTNADPSLGWWLLSLVY